jgi:hypothetical protein
MHMPEKLQSGFTKVAREKSDKEVDMHHSALETNDCHRLSKERAIMGLAANLTQTYQNTLSNHL